MTEIKKPLGKKEWGRDLSSVDGASITCIVFGAIIMFGVPFTVYDSMIKGIFMIFGLLLIGLGILIKHLDIQRQLLTLLKEQNVKENNDQKDI